MIFISHKNDPDHEYAYKIAQLLKDNEITCWIAPESIPKGLDHTVEITNAINACEIFLLVLTKNTDKSVYTRLELSFAIDHHKKIVPVQIGEFQLSDVYKYLLNDRQIMPFDFSEAKCKELVDECKKGERIVNMEISKNPMRTLYLIKGGFSENMDFIIKERPVELNHTVFAMGIDCSSILDLSSTVGILKSVLGYLDSNFGITTKELQAMINHAKIEQLHHADCNQKMNYKDTIVVSIPISINETKQFDNLQLLLIANSRKADNWNGDVDKVVGIDSREIILEVFKKCDELGERAENLVIGAMGTNGTGYPYEVVTAEILNCFVYAKRKSEDAAKTKHDDKGSARVSSPLNLWYSVRQADMIKWGLTSDEILSYISTVVSFFKDD